MNAPTEEGGESSYAWLNADKEAVADPVMNCSNSSELLISSSVGMSGVMQLSRVGVDTQLGGERDSAYPDCT